MEKKKAIKIATAAVIAAGAFTAVAPAQSEAATSLSSKVKTAKATIKKPYSTYFNATKLASVATVEKQIAAAKTAKTKILKTIKDSTASKANKAKYTAEVNAYNKYITRAESYVKGYNAAAKAQTANNKIADKIVAAAASKNGAEVKKQYKALEAAVKKTDKAIKATVYGAKIETLLYNKFTGATKASLAGDLKVANYGEKLQYWIAKGDFATAKKRYDYIDSKLASVTTEAIVKYAEAAKAQYDAAVAIEITSVDALDEANRYLQINFSTVAVAINASDIEIKDSKTGDKFGVKAVTLAANGKSAQVELFASEDDKSVLDENTEYTVTVTVNSKTVVGTFYDAEFIEGRVTDINVQDKEFTIVGDKDKTTRTLKVPKDIDFDYQASLGDIVRVWFNDDNDLVKATIVKASTASEAVEVTKATEVKVLSTGNKYDISDATYENSTSKFKFYLNGEDKTADFKAGKYIGAKVNFAKVGFDKSGDVEFVSAYQLNNFLIVDRVSGDEVVGIQGKGTTGSFNAKDATVVKEGKTVALTELKKGDVLFFNDDADNSDGYAEVLNKTVTGKIDTVYDKAVSVAGNTYKFIADKDVVDAFGIQYGTAVYLDEDGKTDRLDSDAAEQLQAAGDVTIYTDYAGNVVYIAGGVAEVSKNEKTAILTDLVQPKVDYGKAKVQIEALVENNEEEVYDVTLQDLKTITVNGIDYDIENTNPDATEWSVGFDSNTNATKIVLTPGVGNTGAVINLPLEAAGQLVKVVLNSNGNPTELQFFTSVGTKGGEDSLGGAVLEAGDAYFIGKNAGSKKLTSNTVVYDATKGSTVSYKAKDISITTWGKYTGGDILNATAIYNDDNEVEALVISGKTTSDSVYEEAIITNVLRNTDKDIVQIDAFVNGKKETLTVDKVSAAGLEKGDVAILEFDKNNNKLVQGIQENDKRGNEYNSRVITGQTVAADKVDVGASSVTINGTEYKLAADGKVITVGDLNDIKVKNLSDLKGQTNVTVVLDENSGVFVKYFVYGVGTPATPLEVAKAALSTAITAFNTVPEANYTPASYAAYKTAVEAAKAVQANATATQAQIEAATTAVTTAKTNLVLKTPAQTGEIKITSSTALAANDFALMLGAIDYTVEGTVANAPADVTKVTVTFTNANPDAENPASKTVEATVNNGTYKATISAGEFETWTSVKASYTSNGATVESNVATFVPAVK